MVIVTYHVATIPHDWHIIVRLRSSKVIDFNVIWKPLFDLLLVINSNLGPILHRLATIHPLQRTTDDDGRQPCKTPTSLLSSGALWLEPAFPGWRNHMGWSVTTASGLTVWHCSHGTLGAAPLRTSQWSSLWETLICSRVPSPVTVPPRLQLSEKGTSTVHSAAPTTFFPVALKTLGPISVSTQEFLAQIGRRLTKVTTDPRETTFLFQRLSVTVQRFNATCLADTFAISEPAS